MPVVLVRERASDTRKYLLKMLMYHHRNDSREYFRIWHTRNTQRKMCTFYGWRIECHCLLYDGEKKSTAQQQVRFVWKGREGASDLYALCDHMVHEKFRDQAKDREGL